MDDFWSVGLPSWLTGAGTLGLAALAYLSIRRDRANQLTAQADLKRERERADHFEQELREADRIAADRAQAEQIVAYPGQASSDEEGFVTDGGGIFFRSARVAAAIVINESPLPIRDVNIAWCYPEGTGILETRHIPIVPPRSSRAHSWPSSLAQQPKTLPVEIDFADARGVHWKRGRNGELTRLDPEDAAAS